MISRSIMERPPRAHRAWPTRLGGCTDRAAARPALALALALVLTVGGPAAALAQPAAPGPAPGPAAVANASAGTGTSAHAAQAASGGAAADPAAAARGRQIYTSFCARCHGINMVNTGVAFDLRTFPVDQKDRFVRSVTQGLRAMPAWGERFKGDELDALWAYVTTR